MTKLLASEPNAPHLRLVVPEDFKGHKAAGRMTRVYLTLPGFEEVELNTVRNVEPLFPIDGPMSVSLDWVGTCEVVYE